MENKNTVDDEIDLRELFEVLIKNKWLIIATTLMVFLLTVGYVKFTKKDIYETDLLLLSNNNNIIQHPITNKAEFLLSKHVLYKVIDKHNLTTNVRELDLLGFKSVDTDKIHIEKFEVPDIFKNKKFEIIALGNNKFQLEFKGKTVLKGNVDDLVDKDNIKILVPQLNANKNDKFSVVKRNNLDIYNSLINIIKISTNKNTIKLTIKGYDANKITTILNTIAKTAVEEEFNYILNSIDKKIIFLNKKTIKAKQTMKEALVELNSFLFANNKIALSNESEGLINKLVKKQDEILSLELEKEFLKNTNDKDELTKIKSLNEQIYNIQIENGILLTKINRLPLVQQNDNKLYILRGNLSEAKNLYNKVLSKLESNRIIKDNIKNKIIVNLEVLDYAKVPLLPKPSKNKLIAVVGLIVGFILAIFMVFIRNAFDNSIKNATIIEDKLKIKPIGEVPYSKQQAKLTNENLLFNTAKNNLAIKSLRKIGINLHLKLEKIKNNIIMFSSIAQNCGRSFINSNLACVLAEQGKKTLLIDADADNSIEKYFSLDNKNGLIDLIFNDINFKQAIKDSKINNLSIMTTGLKSDAKAEFLLNGNFGKILDKVSKDYDVVIINAPTINKVNNRAVIIARLTSLNFLIFAYGKHNVDDISIAVKQLKQHNAGIEGFVFNLVKD